MQGLKIIDWVAVVLVIIGGINWGLIGLFAFNLVGLIFGEMAWFTRLLYLLVGAAAVYMAVQAPKLGRR
jgi:uncharacterized membrane protein YuzA (DUF378 family)